MSSFDDLIPQKQDKPQSLFADLIPSEDSQAIVPEQAAPDWKDEPFDVNTLLPEKKNVSDPDLGRPHRELAGKKIVKGAETVAHFLSNAWKGDAAYDLPHIADTEVFNESQGMWEDFSNVFKSPESMANAFTQKENKKLGKKRYEVGDDGKGNTIIKKMDGTGEYQPFAYANIAGADWRDFRNVTAEIAPYIAANTLTGGMVSGAGLLTRALSMGAADLAVTFGIGGVSGEAPTNLDVLLSGAGGAAGEAATPLVRKLIGSGKFSKAERQRAKEYIQELGVFEPKKDTIDLFAAKQANQFKQDIPDKYLLTMGETGVPMTQADLMAVGTPAERLAQGKARAKETGLNEVPEMGAIHQEKKISTEAYAEQNRRIYNADRPEADTGQEFIDLIKDQADWELKNAETLYGARTFASSQKMPTGKPVTSVGAVQSPQGYKAGLVTKVEPSREISNLRGRMKEVYDTHRMGLHSNKDSFKKTRKFLTGIDKDVEDMVAKGEWSVGEVDDIYRSINNQITNAKKGTDRKALGDAKKAYRGWLEDTLMPTMKPDERATMQQLLDAGDAYGNYIRKWGSDDPMAKIIASVKEGGQFDDAERIIPALFGDKNVQISGKQAHAIVNLIHPEGQAKMRDLMQEGVVRRLFANTRTGEYKGNVNKMLEEFDAVFGRGSQSDLGNFVFRSGSREREEMDAVRGMLKILSKDEEASLASTQKALSALYARINTPIGIRMVTAIPNIPANMWRKVKARAALNPTKRVRQTPQAARIQGAVTGAATGYAVEERPE